MFKIQERFLNTFQLNPELSVTTAIWIYIAASFAAVDFSPYVSSRLQKWEGEVCLE